MTIRTSSQSFLQMGIRLVVFVMMVGMGYYFLNQPKESLEPGQFVGDPRSSCVYPIEAVNKNLAYKVEGGLPETWEEIPKGSTASRAGYQACP